METGLFNTLLMQMGDEALLPDAFGKRVRFTMTYCSER